MFNAGEPAFWKSLCFCVRGCSRVCLADGHRNKRKCSEEAGAEAERRKTRRHLCRHALFIMELKKFENLPGTSVSVKKNEVLTGKKIRRVIGIDPGLANTGFGIVDFLDGRYRMVSYGCITTKSSDGLSRRLLKIASTLQAVIDEFKPSEAAMEELFFVKNITSGISVAEAKGVCTLILAQNDIPLSEYKPNQIKQAVTGAVKSDKNLVEKYVKILLGLEIEPKPDHAADALAGAITHLHYNLKIC